MREVEGVVDVAGLALEPEGGEPVSTAMPWRDARAGWTLTLAPPDSPWALEHLQVQWRGQELPGVLPAIMRWLVERRAARRAREHEVAVAHEALPGGRFLEPLPHYPLQSHLPPAYAMDELGRATADGPGLLHARQLQGYLALLDQLVAHGSAQLAHLGGLFRHDAGTAPSYRWHVLGGKDVPGLQALLEDTPGAIEQAVCQPLDDAIERRSRMLDVLLALHGQTYAQNALRQSSDHLSPREREHALLLNKQAFAADVVRLQRDRAGGFDWSRPSWNVPDNVSGLQRRVALLLGFGHEGSRTLVSGLRPGLDWCEPDAAGAPQRVPLPAGWQPLDLEAEPPAPSGGPWTFEAALARLPAGLGGAARGDVPLPAPLLHCAARHDRYLVAPRTRQGDRSLLLGPDANGAYWLLAELGWKELARDADLAPRLARRVRQQALARDREAEGLHVVEHLLLRPLAGRPHPDVPAAFHDLQVSVVFPDWTLRCHRPAFRLLAEETVNINLPAHLTAHCLWLGPAAMREFEDAYETWLRARLHWAQMPEDLYRRRALDAWSATLAGKLLGWLRAQTDFDRLASADEAWPAPDDGDDAAG